MANVDFTQFITSVFRQIEEDSEKVKNGLKQKSEPLDMLVVLKNALDEQGLIYVNEEIKEKPAQPDWCAYPDATQPMFGCWSLLGGIVTGEDYCKKCELYIHKRKV